MIDWDDSILVGIPTVDSDHKDILEHINQFITDIEAGSNTLVVHDSFRRMERRIYRHLEAEENLLEAVGYEHTEGHKASHSELTDDLENIWDEMLASSHFQPDEAARNWLESWLFIHVKNDDFMYRDWIFKAGLEKRAEEEMSK